MTANAIVGRFMKLIEDGILVRNTSHDDDFSRYLRDSTRLVQLLKDAEALLGSKVEVAQ